jgi:hypothetical protein
MKLVGWIMSCALLARGAQGLNIFQPCFSPTEFRCGQSPCAFENGVSNKCICSSPTLPLCQFLCPVAQNGVRCNGAPCKLPANQPTAFMGVCECPMGSTGPACDGVVPPPAICSNHGRCHPFETPGVGNFDTNFCCNDIFNDGSACLDLNEGCDRCNCDNTGCGTNPELLTSRCRCDPSTWGHGGCPCVDVFGPAHPTQVINNHTLPPDFQCYCDRGFVGWNCEYICPRALSMLCRWRSDISRCVVNLNDPLAQVNCPTFATEAACNNPVINLQCDPQYGNCAVRMYEPCSGHGECRADFTRAFGDALPQTAYCDCDDGWGGIACEQPCPIGLGGAICSGRGRCLAGGGKPCCQRVVTACNPPQPPNVVCFLPVCSQGGITSPDTNRPYCPGRGYTGASCVCANEFWGPACQFTCPKGTSETAECSGHGTCESPVGLEVRHVCKCSTDWVGKTCDRNCPAGQQSPCSNFGTCTAGVGPHGGFGCQCSAGHLGEFCEAACPVHPTLSTVCSGHGTCVLEFGSAVCRCNAGWNGNACQFQCPLGIGGLECSGANGGCATPPGQDARCVCVTGKTGRACDLDCTTACDSNGLLSSTSCNWDHDRQRTTCTCKPDWHGMRCETDCVQHCGASVGCMANACGFAICECSARGNRVTGTGHCMCLEGFGGPDCSLSLQITGNCSAGQPLGDSVAYQDPDVLCVKVANRSCANVNSCSPQLLSCQGDRCLVETCPGTCEPQALRCVQTSLGPPLCTLSTCSSKPRSPCLEPFIYQPGCKLGKVLSPPLNQFCVSDPVWGPVSNMLQFNNDRARWMSRINDQMSGISPSSNRPAPDWMSAVIGNNQTLSLAVADALCERACYRSTSGPLDEDRSTRFQQAFQYEIPAQSACRDPQQTCRCQACIDAQTIWTNYSSTNAQRASSRTKCLQKQTNQTNMCACAKCLIAQLVCEHDSRAFDGCLNDGIAACGSLNAPTCGSAIQSACASVGITTCVNTAVSSSCTNANTTTQCIDAIANSCVAVNTATCNAVRAACLPTQAWCDRGIAACDKAQLDYSVCVNDEVVHATNDAPYKRSGSGACCCTVGLLKPYALGFGTGRTCDGCGFCGSRYPVGHPQEGQILNGCIPTLDPESGSCTPIPPIQLESGRIIGKWHGIVSCRMGWFGNGCTQSIDSLFPSCTADGGCTGVHLCTLTNDTAGIRGLAYTQFFGGPPVNWEGTTVLTRFYPHGRCVGMNHETDASFTNPINPLRVQHLGLDDTYGFSPTCASNSISDYSFCLRDIPGSLVCHSGWTGELCAQQVV